MTMWAWRRCVASRPPRFLTAQAARRATPLIVVAMALGVALCRSRKLTQRKERLFNAPQAACGADTHTQRLWVNKPTCIKLQPEAPSLSFVSVVFVRQGRNRLQLTFGLAVVRTVVPSRDQTATPDPPQACLPVNPHHLCCVSQRSAPAQGQVTRPYARRHSPQAPHHVLNKPPRQASRLQPGTRL